MTLMAMTHTQKVLHDSKLKDEQNRRTYQGLYKKDHKLIGGVEKSDSGSSDDSVEKPSQKMDFADDDKERFALLSTHELRSSLDRHQSMHAHAHSSSFEKERLMSNEDLRSSRVYAMSIHEKRLSKPLA